MAIIQGEHERYVHRHLRHNITFNMAEGIFYWIGQAFYSYQTVLPLFISKLTSSPYPLGILAMLGNSGWLLPQLFTARWVHRTRVKKYIVVRVGFFSERLPLILLALIAWTLATTWPKVTLILTLLVAAWAAYGGGLIAIAWQSMITKVIPQDMRGRFIGVSSALGMAGGTVAAAAVTYTLNTRPFPQNFALSFSLGAVCAILSWLSLTFVREPPDPEVSDDDMDISLWRDVPRVVRRDRDYAWFLVARSVAALSSMGTGFLAVYAIRRWHLSDGQAGVFSGALMGAQFVAYLVLGVLADHHGHKRVLEIGALAATVGFLLATASPIPHLIYLSFAGLGVMQASYIVSGMMIVPEFSPPEHLALYFGIASTLTGIVAVSAPMVGAWLVNTWGYPTVFTISGLAGFLAWGVLFTRVVDPRYREAVRSAQPPVHDHHGDSQEQQAEDEASRKEGQPD